MHGTLQEGQATIARRLRRQADACAQLGSPLYSMLLQATARDVERGGPAWAVLAGHEDDAPGSVPALRLMGAIHRLVLEGRAPDLARYYPSAGGNPDSSAVWAAFSGVLRRNVDTLRELMRRPVQTNEVGRSRALLGGFLEVAQETGLPLSLLEVGASAGLNLRWDRFRYRVGDADWGDPASPLCLEGGFTGGLPPFEEKVTMVARRGCDASPVNPLTAEGRLTLLSYIWADQVRRIAQLEAAIEVAARVPARIDTANAPEWLEQRLAERERGTATVVFHSIVMQYLAERDRERLHELLCADGRRADAAAPLAWLRMEPAGEQAEVRLTIWPGGAERLLARCGYHGEPVHWLSDLKHG